ncbi:hypothetical protein Tco_0656373 [Tanacetum coccineum]|uniref:Uncharacterized protein n=1 Tax=Tanacetum coccineum TaxID=301880 RepID=A0ABQ4X8N7_9ASTR
MKKVIYPEAKRLLAAKIHTVIVGPSPSCDHFDAECGLINSLFSRDISITSPKIDFLPEEFIGELDFIDLILPGIDKDDFDENDYDEDDFDEEEGEIDIDIFQIKDEILREKLLNVHLLIDKIKALKNKLKVSLRDCLVNSFC